MDSHECSSLTCFLVLQGSSQEFPPFLRRPAVLLNSFIVRRVPPVISWISMTVLTVGTNVLSSAIGDSKLDFLGRSLLAGLERLWKLSVFLRRLLTCCEPTNFDSKRLSKAILSPSQLPKALKLSMASSHPVLNNNYIKYLTIINANWGLYLLFL